MCLYLMVTPGLGKKECREFATWLSNNSPLQVDVGRGKNARTLHLSLDSGCACSMLTESADWNAKVWLFRDEILPQVTDTISTFASKHKSEFILEAMWDGDKSEGEETITVDELIKVIESNQVRNKLTSRVVNEAS